LSQSLSGADLHLVTMEAEAEGLVVPSKIYGALAADRPVAFLGPSRSEAARLLEDARCGTVLSNVSGASLAEAIARWHASDEKRQAAGRRARAAVADRFDRSVDAFGHILRNTL